MSPAQRVVAKKRHSSLLVSYLESPNYAPRVLIGAFLATTVAIQLVLTGPSGRLIFSGRIAPEP